MRNVAFDGRGYSKKLLIYQGMDKFDFFFFFWLYFLNRLTEKGEVMQVFGYFSVFYLAGMCRYFKNYGFFEITLCDVFYISKTVRYLK